MGMFDTIYVHRSKLPVSSKEKRLFDDETDFQTKSLDRLLDVYEVDRFGELSCNKEKCGYTGWINFYTDTKNGWYEFDAQFENGKLISINHQNK